MPDKLKPETQSPVTSQGTKHDQGKPRLELIPSIALFESGKVLAFGANKYSPWNWSKGIVFSRLIGACYRHLAAYNSGEDVDPESGLSHIAHSLCCLYFLVWMAENRPDMDDRIGRGSE
jgi:hypothetical protein